VTNDPVGGAVADNPVAVRRKRILYLAIVATLLVGVATARWAWTRSSGIVNPGAAVKAPTEVDFDFVVAMGTSERVQAGETMTVMPDVLHAKVGQVIRIDNQDDVASDVGPFRVPARSVLTQKFTKPGTFIGRCVISPTGSARIIVTS
jgi:hypothetical protein